MSQAEIDTELEKMRQKQIRNGFKDRKPKFDQSVADYFDSLHEKESRRMDYATARTHFYSTWYRIVGNKPFLDSRDEWIPRELVKWIIKDPSCQLDLKKGILMCGTQGCGKTTMIKAAMVLSAHDFQFRRIGAIKMEVEEFKSITALKPYFKGSWCFDDIGQENEDVVVFSKHNIIKSLINTRITLSSYTHGTTNLMPGEIEERYGKVISSRFNEMFTPVVFESEQDCRKL